MAAQMTPSKQAASAIENFNMESPVKKLDFGAANKENEPLNQTTDTTELKTKIVEETKEEPKTAITSSTKAEEADEPLLQENPQRFVLFPIKYHEVSDAF
jgi:ribonucleoside-diphosphate reductase subunit M2